MSDARPVRRVNWSGRKRTRAGKKVQSKALVHAKRAANVGELKGCDFDLTSLGPIS